jgi:hypothetical protein
MKKLLLFLFLISCVPSNSNYKANNEFLDFDKDLTFDEFDNLLTIYAESTSYPDINK